MAQPELPVDFGWASPELQQQLRTDPHAVLKDRGVEVPAEFPPAIVHDFVRIALLLWVEGKTVPLERFYIDPSDEGLLFGRGVWESTRTINGIPWLWQWHVERLLKTAGLLNIPLTPDQVPDSAQVSAYVRSLTAQQDVVIRLNVSAGRPGKPGLVWMSAAPMPYPPPFLRLRSVVNPVQKGQALLVLKTFQYATRLRTGQLASTEGFDTALLCDDTGNLQEAAHANVFVKLPDGWATPTADGGLLPGTVRQFLLEKAPIRIREQVIPRSRLNEVQEAFVTNSNLGIVPITQIDDHTYPVGPDTQKLVAWIQPPVTGVQYRFLERKAPLR